MKKSTHPLLQLLVMLAMSLGMLFLTSTVSAVLVLANGEMSTSFVMMDEAVTQILVFIVPVILMTYIYYRDNQREYYRLDFSSRKWYYALAGIVIMLLLIPFYDLLTEWNDSWNLGRLGEMLRSLQDKTEGIMQQLVGGDSVGRLLANLVVVALLPAVCEELFFRAGIQNLIQRWLKNPHAAIWITALIFSLAHGELFSFMPRFAMGAVLGYLYVYGGSLLPNIATHFVNNALIVVLYWLSARGIIDIDPEEPLNLTGTIIAACSLAALALFYAVFLMNRKKETIKG